MSEAGPYYGRSRERGQRLSEGQTSHSKHREPHRRQQHHSSASTSSDLQKTPRQQHQKATSSSSSTSSTVVSPSKAVLLREPYRVQRQHEPLRQFDEEDDDGYEEYTVYGHGQGPQQTPQREPHSRRRRDRDRRQTGLLLLAAAFVLSLFFYSRKSRR
ncbi:hypothetical protein VTK73DRAFT_6944 [Phialemonium thermophilum]|uniref:Uncharacterized protein n=1 Tax=Phialemonium thermophilum TaxID=223376 RepID=A0ABR3XUY0_9PEZI